MKFYEARFFMETLAILFEQRRKVCDMLDDMHMRLEELESELGHMMRKAGYDTDQDDWLLPPIVQRGQWDSLKVGLDADGACDCGCKPDPSYRMD